tara:strand:+ start:135867 stop:137132 length:1266 start_codon:yes stop_codon:yes gene_type:complete
LKTITQIKKHAAFGIVFTIAKATVYIAPLLVAEILSKEDFGILEYALAGLGMVINTLINLGVPSAYPYFKLKNNNIAVDNVFNFHYTWLLAFFIISQVCYYTFNFDLSYFIALNVAFVISNQLYISTQLKTKEKISIAVLFDSGVYVVILLFVVLSYLKIVTPSIQVVSNLVQCYAILYVFHAIYQFLKIDFKELFNNYRSVLAYSFPVLIGSLLIYFLTVSGRILIEFFLNDYELVGIYAFYFRLSAVIVMLHQVINIVFFKKMYQLNPKILDHYFSICFGGLYIISISAFVVVPYILPYFSEFYETTKNDYKSVYFLLCTQMVFWIATALFSNIIDREKLANKNNKLFLFLLTVFLFVLWVIKSNLTIQIFTFVHMFVVFLATLIQIYSLTKKQIVFKKSFYTIIGINLLSLMIFLFLL